MGRTALIVVDVQRDFCPGGALPVPAGNEVIGPINELVQAADAGGQPVLYTRDWHPPDHCSFRSQGGQWPEHCVRETPGAQFHPDEEAYSGFQNTKLDELLRGRGVSRVIVTGLATDYCVKATALDALTRGYEVWVVREAVRGVDVRPGDSQRALDEIRAKGGKVVSLEEAKSALRQGAVTQ